MNDAGHGAIEQAVRAEIARLAVPASAAPALHELALQLAYRADNSTSARDLPGLSRELRNCLEELAKVAPPAVKPEETPLERRRRERAERPATA